jgi:hypothetical protein
MISIVIKLLEKLAAVLESAVAREQKALEAKLAQAAALVSKANDHRRAINTGRKVAAVIGAVVADTQPKVVVAETPVAAPAPAAAAPAEVPAAQADLVPDEAK